MNLNQIKILAKLKTMIYSATTIEPTTANIQSIDNDVTLDINGDFMSMVIKYTGIVNIYNKLPDGFSISLNQDTIIIRNILNRKIQGNLLFKFSGEFLIKSAVITTYTNKTLVANTFNKNELELLESSKTNVEDDTIIFTEAVEPDFDLRVGNSKSTIDDDTIYGLYTDKAINGYTGYYHYHPKEKIYMSGKRLSAQSVPITSDINKTEKKRALLKKVYNKLVIKTKANKRPTAKIKTIEEELKPIEVQDKQTTKQAKTKKEITKGGGY
tara:strand:+ start:591 stop:1397 length:807 start_codon:yes stop_codon:yes gene_type:complete